MRPQSVDCCVIESIIKYWFKDENLLQNAFTHPSFHKNIYFDRLEFLGDHVLSYIVADYIFRNFPTEDTGTISLRYIGVTNTNALAYAAKQLNLQDFVVCTGHPSDSVLADTIEALIGAISVDGGYLQAKKFIIKNIINISNLEAGKNSKNLLQEWAQKNKYDMPTYKYHDNHENFHTIVKIKGINISGTGIAKSKKQASIAAADDFLQKLAQYI